MTFPDTTFVNNQTVIYADWLNAVNDICATATGENAGFQVDRFSGNGTTVDFTLTHNAPSEDYLFVFINGVYQEKNTYSYNPGTQIITFSVAPPIGTDNIEVVSASTFVLSSADASTVTYEPPFANSVATTVQNKLAQTVSVKDFGAVGDGVTDDTVAFTAAIAYMNANGGELWLENGQYLIDAGVIVLTRDGTIISGNGKGNPANLIPSTPAPTTLIFKGIGAGIRVKAQSVTLKDFRITSDTTRSAASFDITSPGIRVEPDDTATARADRCVIHDVRIDNQPGDGVLTVALTVYADYERIDVYECMGFGFRFDPGTWTGLTRTYPFYVGLSQVNACRVGYCGGHSIAASNPNSVTQATMAIRLLINDMDSFGNGQNTSIMYPTADGNFYDFWIFSENSIIQQCGPCGRVGLSLTPEVIGGICIGGRDNKITNCRFIDTKQPIYWRYVSAQPSTGLEIDMFRLVNTTLTHTYMVAYQSPNAKGLRVTYDRNDFLTYVAPPAFGGGPTDQLVIYQGKPRHINSIFTTQPEQTLDNDTVYSFEFNGSSTILTYGVFTIACSSHTSGGAIFHIRCASTNALATKWVGEANTVAYPGGGPLTGTTGNVGELTISCDATKVYIENRIGYTIAFSMHLASVPLETGINQ